MPRMLERRYAYRIWWGNWKEKDNLEDLGVDEDNSKITLKEKGWEGG